MSNLPIHTEYLKKNPYLSPLVYPEAQCKDIPMSELLDIWLESKKPRVKISSLAHYRRVVDTILKPHFEGKTTTSITRFDIRMLTDNLLRRFSVAYTANIITITNQILEFMCDNEYTLKSPKANVKLPNQAKARPKVFTRSEQKILMNHLTNNMSLTNMGVILSLYTGLRIGELCGLQWRDVDLVSNVIRVNRTIQRISDGSGHTYFIAGTPKTVHSEREIPLPSFIVDMIKPFERETKTAYILSGTENFVQPRTFENRYKKILRDSGVSKYNFHTLRHTFATRAIELGFDPKSLSEILGHSNVKLTLDLYVHPSLEQKQKEMELLAAIF